MADLASITGLITAAGSAFFRYHLSPAVIGLANKANTVDANQKIIELQQRMAEVQQGFAELFQENQTLKEDNRKLQDEINAEAMYPFRESVRWKKNTDGGDDGPFCLTCFANKKVLMPLKFKGRMNKPGLLSFVCPEAHTPVPGMRLDGYHVEAASIRQGRYTYPD